MNIEVLIYFVPQNWLILKFTLLGHVIPHNLLKIKIFAPYFLTYLRDVVYGVIWNSKYRI